MESIEKLRVYQSASQLEDAVYRLVKKLPREMYYPTGNEARRASAAVSHHIHQAHQRYSYQVKLEELDQARRAAESMQRLLDALRPYGADDKLIEGYTAVIKQSWGLTKYLRQRMAERKTQAAVRGADELVAARAG